jgi:hypothetical protein
MAQTFFAANGGTRCRAKGRLEVLQSGERIEDYPDDTPYPSALFLEFVASKPLHVVAAFDEVNQLAYVITAYEPSLEVFENDYKTRRNP